MKKEVSSKTEFLFESDAEKVILQEAAKPRKPKIALKIFRNSIIFSILLLSIFYILNTYETKILMNIKANTISDKITFKNDEKMNESSAYLEDYSNNSNNKYELLVNKKNSITDEMLNNYEIVYVANNTYDNVWLEKVTYSKYLELKIALEKKGYYLNIINGYKTFEESKNIYNSYVIEKGKKYAEKYVPKPGFSEHNAGLAMDIIISSNKTATNTDYKSDEYLYLENIAYLYGFIIRYPKGKETVTGYEYEPWHLRYVGNDLAKYLRKNNITLEEYYSTKH